MEFFAKWVGKVLKICRKYLRHIHKSVFEGALTDAELKRLKKELARIIRTEEDAICIYKMEHINYAKKEEMYGCGPSSPDDTEWEKRIFGDKDYYEIDVYARDGITVIGKFRINK